MEIVEGKFYKTRDGRKAFVESNAHAIDGYKYPWFYKTDRISYHAVDRNGKSCLDLETDDLIAEWQDEPKKEISDMGEVKFKVGDYITRPIDGWNEQGYQVAKIDDVHVWVKPDYESNNSHQYALRQTRDHWFLVKSAKDASIPEIGTKWVFNDGQDFVVRVVGFNDKGQIVLEALSEQEFHVYSKFEITKSLVLGVGTFFTFENEPEKFGEFYKPWVEKIVGFNAVVRWKKDNSISFFGCFDTEEEARSEVHNQWNAEDIELLDIVKVEWEEA